MNNDMSADAGTMQKWYGYTIYCAKCSETGGTGGADNMTKKQAETMFREFGWIKRNGAWLCPTCAKKKPPRIVSPEKAQLLRVRFRANDSRPIHWPIKYPSWESGFNDDHCIVIAYADSQQYIFDNWPEASHLEIEAVDKIVFTSRFPKPDWFNEEAQDASN